MKLTTPFFALNSTARIDNIFVYLENKFLLDGLDHFLFNFSFPNKYMKKKEEKNDVFLL